jgi:hypothetical protein
MECWFFVVPSNRMTNVQFASIDEYQDLETLNMYREQVLEKGADAAKVMEAIYTKGSLLCARSIAS